MRVRNFHFWVNYPFNNQQIKCIEAKIVFNSNLKVRWMLAFKTYIIIIFFILLVTLIHPLWYFLSLHQFGACLCFSTIVFLILHIMNYKLKIWFHTGFDWDWNKSILCVCVCAYSMCLCACLRSVQCSSCSQRLLQISDPFLSIIYAKMSQPRIKFDLG